MTATKNISKKRKDKFIRSGGHETTFERKNISIVAVIWTATKYFKKKKKDIYSGGLIRSGGLMTTTERKNISIVAIIWAATKIISKK